LWYYAFGDNMNNKKIAILVIIFIVFFMLIATLIGIAGKIPFISKPLMLILAVILVLFVLTFFILISKRRK
jgi:hypothetical protein